MKKKTGQIVFLMASILNLVGQFLPQTELASFSKVLLMPSLLFFVVENTKGYVNKTILMLAVALIFSWIGDLFLLEDDYFLYGIGAFLLAQVTYILVFRNSSDSKPQFNALLLLPYLIYAFFLFYLILPSSGELQIPIIIYGITLLGMGYLSALRKDGERARYKRVILGSSLFIISDSLIALNMFYTEIPQRGFLVMITYIAAQYLIVTGIVSYHSTKSA